MKTKSLELLQALNTAAAILQQVSLSEADVFNACRAEIARLGFRGGLSVLDETGQKLIIKTTVQPEWLVKILDDLEVRTGYHANGYSFPYNQVLVYREVIEAIKAVFISDSSAIISQMLPEGIRSLAGVVIKAMGSPPGIYAPLKRHGQPFGVLNILGQQLTPDDIPAVEAFANHISIALENARLFEALRETEKNAKEFQEKMRTLHEVNFELSGIESLDGLYHAAVQAGLNKLGFERFALFLIEEDGKYLAGTYGTDEKGSIRDEHHIREEINATRNKFILNWLLSRTRSTHLKNVTLHGAGQDLDRKGSNVFAIVWNGSQAIGMLAIDNYLTQRPPQPFVEELLSMYGNVIGHLITRLRNEQALRESEQRYRALFEESPISIWEEDFSQVKQRIETLRVQGVKDFQSYFESHPEEVAECAALVKVVDVNKAALKIYHAEKKEDLLISLREILESSRSLTTFRGELVGIANGETAMYRENIDATLTGELIDVSLSWQVAPGYENSLSKVIVSIIDITARKDFEREREKLITDLETKNAEAETLRESTTIVAATLEISETVQSILDQLKRVIPYDSASVWLYKNNKSIMLGAIDLPHTDTVPEYNTLNAAEPDYPFWSENAAYILLEDIQENYPIFREPPLDYIHGWLAVSLRMRGKPTGFISLDSRTPGKFTTHDAELALIFANQVSIALENARLFTELQVELDARQDLIAELENKNAELERFTYTVSHDLRSPLVTIKGFLGYLERSASAGNMESFRKDMARISSAADRMDNLLKDVLELSRIGRLVNKPQAVPFDDLVKEAVEIVHGRLEARGITLQILSPLGTQPNLPLVNVDKPRLIEVLQNLIDNAAKYMGTQQTNPRIEIGTMTSDAPGTQTFFVRDNGMGIAPEYHERIFGLFDKLDVASEGTGVGLALVKRIIEFHGGRIWVESAVGQGSTFYFTLQG